MSSFRYKRTYDRYANLMLQKKRIESTYKFLSCSIDRDNVLRCSGWLQPTNCEGVYKVKVEYVAGKEPKSTIISPFVQHDPKIHMYSDHSLCLHYPPDMPWNEKINIAHYTIPWISEWIYYYEIYQLNGNIWEGPESPSHIRESDKNVNKDY